MKTTPEQDREHQHQRQHADKSEHATCVGEDKVGLTDLEQSELTLGAAFNAESAESARANAYPSLNQVEAISAGIGLRVEKDGPAASLILRQEELPGDESDRRRGGTDGEPVAPSCLSECQDCDPDHAVDEAGPEIGLPKYQRHRQEHDQHRNDEIAELAHGRPARRDE